MQFAAIGNWILMFLGQAWFFLAAYGQFEIFPAIFIVTIIIDLYLHLCEVRAAAFMKNKGVHWRNSCSGKFSNQNNFIEYLKNILRKLLKGFFCGVDNKVDPETVVPLDDPRIQNALAKRNQGGVQPTADF